MLGPFLNARLDGRGKWAFIQSLPQSVSVLDVGCGDTSYKLVKAIRPDLAYTGLDVQGPQAPDRIVVPPSAFSEAITAKAGSFDVVLSVHNLEHCSAPNDVLSAMCGALKPGGRMYLSFPSRASTTFPSRRGTLNFYDDPTHTAPPDFADTKETLLRSGMTLEYSREQQHAPLLFLIGAICEPISALSRRCAPLGATWAFYGFESTIWAYRTE